MEFEIRVKVSGCEFCSFPLILISQGFTHVVESAQILFEGLHILKGCGRLAYED